MNDAEHARLALQMLPRANGLSDDEKAAIRARAHSMLGKTESEIIEADAYEAASQTSFGQLNRPMLKVVAKRDSKETQLLDNKDRMSEADRGGDGKFHNDYHTTNAREHVLAASIAANSNDTEEAGRRIESASIHASHSQNTKAPAAIESLAQAKDALKAGNIHDVQRNLDTAYGHLQGLPNVLLKAKKVRESDPAKRLIETLTFHPRLIEGTFNPDARTVDVIIISEGMGNKRDKHYYRPDALAEAVKDGVFDGAQAYADHPSKFDDQNRPERSVRDLIGYYFNDKIVESQGKPAIGATLKIQEGCDWALGLVKEAIDYQKKFPDKQYVGISINADGDTVPTERDGQQVNDVTKITEAFSADMVTKPARGGKFLKLVESGSGSKGAANVSKLTDAATQLEKLAEGEEIDPAMLRSIAKNVREAEGDAADISKKGSSNNKVGTNQIYESMSEAQKQKWGAQFGEANKEAWGKMDEAAQKKWADDNADGDGGGNGGGSGGSQQESQPSGKGNLVESDLKKQFPTIFAAALKEAQESFGSKGGGNDELATLRARNAELEAANSLRESATLAATKLKESKLPEGAFEDVLRSIIGLEPDEMDQVIRAREAFVESLGISITKKPGGAGGGGIALRESADTSNTAALIAGVVED